MRHLKTVVLALTAVFALSAFASATASAALPELVSEGKELPAGTTIKSKSGKGTFELKSGEKVTCSADTDTGEVTGPKLSKATISFTGCSAFGILKCNTSGAKSGEIVLKVIAKLVYINKTTKEVGLDQELEKELVIECGSLQKLKVRGSSIGVLTPINTSTEKLTLTFSQSKGVQKPTEYENEKGEKIKDITETKGEGLKSFEFEQSGLTSTDELEFGSPAKKVEVKA